MATFYFDKWAGGFVDANWQTLGNWWLNRAATIPATSLPTSSDDVVMLSICSENTGSEPTVNTAILEDHLAINLTVTNGMIVKLFSQIIFCTITGNVIFEDDSSLAISGIINGNASFTENSYHLDGTITGTTTYEGLTGIIEDSYSGNITFTNGRASKFYWNGAVDGDWQTLGNWWISSNTSTWPAAYLPLNTDDVVIKSSTLTTNSGGAITVNNLTIESSGGLNYTTITVSTLCIVEGWLYDNATINGNVRSIGYGSTGGNITGNLEMRDYSYSYVGQFGDPLGGNLHCMDNAEANVMTIAGNALFEDDSLVSAGSDMSGNPNYFYGPFEVFGNIEMRNSSYNVGAIRCEGTVTFHDSSKNHGYYYSNATQGIIIALEGCYFLDNSEPMGSLYSNTITNGFIAYDYATSLVSPLIMSLQPTANLLSFMNGIGNADPISFVYNKGINGSSILGVV